jgi:predicted  nucleic acid-binding Zn-ribbon protein
VDVGGQIHAERLGNFPRFRFLSDNYTIQEKETHTMSNMKLIMERFNSYVTEQESPIDQYVKLEKELEAAEKAGDKEEIKRIEAEMDKLNIPSGNPDE